MNEGGDGQAGDSSLFGSKQKHMALGGCFFRAKISGLQKPHHPYSGLAGFGPCLSTGNSYTVKILQKLEKIPTLLPHDVNMPELSAILSLGCCLACEEPSINPSFLLFDFIFQL